MYHHQLFLYNHHRTERADTSEKWWKEWLVTKVTYGFFLTAPLRKHREPKGLTFVGGFGSARRSSAHCATASEAGVVWLAISLSRRSFWIHFVNMRSAWHLLSFISASFMLKWHRWVPSWAMWREFLALAVLVLEARTQCLPNASLPVDRKNLFNLRTGEVCGCGQKVFASLGPWWLLALHKWWLPSILFAIIKFPRIEIVHIVGIKNH